MDIREHTFTGIVGESGSGKSTIASLIMGRNFIKQGTLTIAGSNVSDINEDSLFKNINYVGIGSTFFKGTVRENLLFADPEASEEELWNALAECNIDGFFKEENGLDTLLTENAGNLSGGQKQYISERLSRGNAPRRIIRSRSASARMRANGSAWKICMRLLSPRVILTWFRICF